MQTEDLAALLDPGPRLTDGAFRVHVLAQLLARAERRRAWRKSLGWGAAAAGLGLAAPVLSLAALPPLFLPVAVAAAGIGLGVAALPSRRRLRWR